MLRVLALIGEWLLKNSVQKILKGAGLSVASYLGILTAIRVAFDKLMQNVNSIGGELLGMLGLIGLDYVLSAYVSVAMFLLMLNQGKLFIKGASK